MLPSIRGKQNKENLPSRRVATETKQRYPRSQSIREYQPKLAPQRRQFDLKTQQSDEEMPLRSPWFR